jgi:uncharacterized protein
MSQPVVSFRQFVLKVHSRCDLACDHCYVYFGADQSWRDRPKIMAEQTVAWAAQRMAEHAKAHQLRDVRVVLHGGEPLLAGVRRLRNIVETLRAELNGVCDLDLRIHTNGVRLDDAFCEMFAATSVKVGISIDGNRAANDRHRRYADGRSSYDQVISAINLLNSDRYRHLYLGLLCTVDILNDPVASYESLLALKPPRIDFLLPHATWDQPPARPPGSAAAYADWLIEIFERWQADGQPVGIRLFDSIVSAARGTGSFTEAIGLAASDLVVIETDGSYEQADSLKASYHGAPVTGFDVFSQCLDEVAAHQGIQARQAGLAGLCEKCQACPVVRTCGGGLYAHRYSAASGFANPSVYCADLMKLIRHVHQRTPAAASRPDGEAAAAVHALPAADFDALASGYGGAAVIGRLAQTQRSLRRGLLSAVYEMASASAGCGAETAELPAAWDTLTRVDTVSPDAVEAVLSHPYVRVWLVRCLELLRSQRAAAGGGAAAGDLGYLSAIAIVAAIRAGADATAAVALHGGSLYLPTLGRLVIGDPGAAGTATIETTAHGAVTIRHRAERWRASWSEPAGLAVDDGGAACWQPVRYLSAPGIKVTLEDTDRFRDCHQWAAAPRASGEQFAAWDRQFRAAWALIAGEHDAYAPALSAGLTTVMPLSAPAAGREISATARNAFGAVAAAMAADPAALALLLIHEFQHVKLGAMLDLYDLFDPADDRLFDAPWRQDRRPLEGLLQGTYAHVAVTDFWRIRRQAPGPCADAAASRFAHWRVQTAKAIETLDGSGSLTLLGKRFVGAMGSTVSSWPG